MIALNLIGSNYFGVQITWFELLMFSLGSFLITSILLWFYERIPKHKTTPNEPILNNPIYQSKDVLLQEREIGVNYFPTESTTSIWVKFLIYILIAFVVIIPLYRL